VIVPTRELLVRDPGIVPPNEALAIDRVRSVAKKSLSNIYFSPSELLFAGLRGEGRLRQESSSPQLKFRINEIKTYAKTGHPL
jgi:hypothetical protein